MAALGLGEGQVLFLVSVNSLLPILITKSNLYLKFLLCCLFKSVCINVYLSNSMYSYRINQELDKTCLRYLVVKIWIFSFELVAKSLDFKSKEKFRKLQESSIV